MDDESARTQMIAQQVRAWEVLDPRVLDTMAAVPREQFVPPGYRQLAFADMSIPLPCGQVMMTPTVEGRVLQALAVEPSSTVLDVGTGSGFLAACLGHLGHSVLSIDVHAELTEMAADTFKRVHVRNVALETADALAIGAERRYDAICVTGSVEEYTDVFARALNIGGRLFIIVGRAPVMQALLVTRVGDNEWAREPLFETVIPPLEGASRARRFVF